jgi:DNA-binding protein H-NS
MANKLDELQQQIELLMKQKDELLRHERDSALNEINAKIKLFGFKPKDLYFGNRSVGIFKPTVPAKYKKGNDTWSGRGRKPRWLEEHLAKGGKLDDLLIKT